MKRKEEKYEIDPLPSNKFCSFQCHDGVVKEEIPSLNVPQCLTVSESVHQHNGLEKRIFLLELPSNTEPRNLSTKAGVRPSRLSGASQAAPAEAGSFFPLSSEACSVKHPSDRRLLRAFWCKQTRASFDRQSLLSFCIS